MVVEENNLTGTGASNIATRISQTTGKPRSNDQCVPPTTPRANEFPSLRETERALQESEQKYRNLFEQSRDAVYITDLQGQFIDLNPATVDLLGYNREEFMGLHPIDLCADTNSRRYLGRLDKQGRKPRSIKDIEVELRRKDGIGLNCLLTATPRQDKDGNIIGYQGIIHDITQRKALEAQFLQAQRLESFGRLAGGIAHDFNNLLGGIMGYVSLLKERLEPTTDLYEFASIIEMATHRGTQLTQQLLTTERKTPAKTQPLNINETIKEILRILSHYLYKNVTVKTRLQRNIPPIAGDPAQMHQILMNLCINATDAMPKGGTLTITSQEINVDAEFSREHIMAELGRTIQITVSDTGAGISQDDQPKIFDPFFTTKEPGKGTGLGLAVVYAIVKNHRGMIEVDSEEDQGSTFRVYLPVYDRKSA